MKIKEHIKQQRVKKIRPRDGSGCLYLKRKEPAATYFPPVWSIIGAGELDFRVRNGNGYDLSAMATGTINAKFII